MALKRASNVDYGQNQILNAVVQNLSAAPSSPRAGQIYYDSVLQELGYWNGTSWIYSTTVADATTSSKGVVELTNDLGGTATSPTVVGLHLAGDTAINHKLTSVTDPTNPQDAATKNYVDGKLNGLAWKSPAVAATTTALPANTQSGAGATGTLTANANGALTVDGYAVQANDIILVKNEATGKNNGRYTVSNPGSGGAPFVLVRAADSTTAAQMQDETMLVEQGTSNGDTVWNLSNSPGFTVDTTALTYVVIQNATVITGDGVYTTRSGTQITFQPSTGYPAAPANGAVANPSGTSIGATRKAIGALTHDGSTTSFTITHNLNTTAVSVIGQLNNSGVPGQPIELDWSPGTANTVVITYPAALTAGTTHFVTTLG